MPIYALGELQEPANVGEEATPLVYMPDSGSKQAALAPPKGLLRLLYARVEKINV